MRVGIVGAGLAGLGAARTLKELGHDSVVYEASGSVGGRLASEQLGPYIFDTGASSIAPRGLSLEPVMCEELDRTDLETTRLPICIHTGLRVSGGDPLKNRVERFVYRNGNQELARLLAEDLDVRLNAPIAALERINGTYACDGDLFDALVITLPAPQAKVLLLSVGESRYLANTSYRACLSVMLGYAAPPPEINYCALLDPDQRHPLTWLSIDSLKCSGRAPEGHTAMVAQLSAEFSSRHFESSDEAIILATVDFISRLYGKAWLEPSVSKVARWRYSHPETTSLFESANAPGDRVIAAGDGVMGARVEFAYESGVRAAKLLAGV